MTREEIAAANEIYAESRRIVKGYDLPRRAIQHLIGEHLVNDKNELDKNKVREYVVSGKIWGKRGIGHHTIKEICNWLSVEEKEFKR